MEIDEIRAEAEEYFEDISPAHDWHHVKRVERLSERLMEEAEADETVVRLAVLLHDIGREREDRGDIEDHAEWGAERAGEILQEHGVEQETIDQVKHCIRSHRYSNSLEPETVEAEILSDADNLDAIGAVGVARAFTVAGERGRTMVDPDLPPEEDGSETGRTALNHIYMKGFDLKDRMYTGKGKKIAEKRHEYLKDYVRRLEEEVRGSE